MVLAARGPVTTTGVATPRAVATPIGDGQMALITSDSVEGQATINVEVRLPSGRTGTARIVDRSGDVWLIELHQAEPGHAIAAGRPAGSEIVTVMATPPVTVAFADISKLDIREGTAVLDADGNLVGLCTRRRGDGSVRLLDVRAELVDATTVDP